MQLGRTSLLLATFRQPCCPLKLVRRCIDCFPRACPRSCFVAVSTTLPSVHSGSQLTSQPLFSAGPLFPGEEIFQKIWHFHRSSSNLVRMRPEKTQAGTICGEGEVGHNKKQESLGSFCSGSPTTLQCCTSPQHFCPCSYYACQPRVWSAVLKDMDLYLVTLAGSRQSMKCGGVRKEEKKTQQQRRHSFLKWPTECVGSARLGVPKFRYKDGQAAFAELLRSVLFFRVVSSMAADSFLAVGPDDPFDRLMSSVTPN